MKKITQILALSLLLSILLASCAKNNPQNNPEPSLSDNTSSIAPAQTTTELQDVELVKFLPEPYIDIEFTEDGGIFDAMGHVTCKLENEKKGTVVNENVTIGGKEYKFPHLYVKESGGFARLTYKDITEKNDLFDLLSGGLTLETMIVNANKFTPSSSEQMIAGTCQSGGYNFSCYKGSYTFSVYAGGGYRSAHNPTGVINDSMTHLIGVYDPNLRSSSLYVNGKLVSSVTAEGMFGLASGDLWKQIILGADIGNNFSTHIPSSNTRIADYKLYPSPMTEDEVETAYEQMKVKLMGETVDYTLEYYEKGEMGDGTDRIFASIPESFAQVYEPKSSIVNSPTVITYATKDNFSAIASATARAATIIFGVKLKSGVLYAYDQNGNELSSLKDAVKGLGGKVIPAFEIYDSSVVRALIDFINYNYIGDCFVVSKNAGVVENVCKSTRAARPIIDMSNDTSLDIKKIRTTTSEHGAKAVILNSSLLSPEQVTLLRASGQSVFLKIGDKKSDVHDAIFKGAMGIVTENANDAISYIESFKTETLCFPSLIVAHRGDMQNCPENVMRSFISAAESGAPIIELDVYMTTDGHIAINHDGTTTHWNNKLTLTESTRAELKALKNTQSSAKEEDVFTFLDEVFDYFSKNHTDMIIHVEIKDRRNAVVDKCVSLAKQYGMLDRIVVICFNHDIVRYAMQAHGVSVQMVRSYIHDRNDPLASLAFACEEIVRLNSSYYTIWNDSLDALNVLLRHRGIKYCTWPTNTAAETDKYYTRGYSEFTSNTPHRCDKYAHYLKAEIDAQGNVKVIRVNYDQTTEDVTSKAQLVPISGNVTFQNGKVSGSGEFAFSYSTSVSNYNYNLCSVSYER